MQAYSPLVSIIIPVYNAQKFIEECVSSIERQTHKNLEIIVIDDGSSDDSLSICKSLASKDDRVSVFTQKNAGPSASRNRGKRLAKGDYLLFIDADDVLKENAIEVCLDRMMADDSDLALFTFERIDSSGEILFAGNTEERTIFPQDQVCSSMKAVQWLLLGYYQNYVWRIFARKTVWNDIDFPEDRVLMEDAQIYPFILLQAARISFINQSLYQYRICDESLVSSNDALGLVQVKDVVLSMRSKELLSKYPEFEEYCSAERYIFEFNIVFSMLKYHNPQETQRWKQAELYIKRNKTPKLFLKNSSVKKIFKNQIAKMGIAFLVR